MRLWIPTIVFCIALIGAAKAEEARQPTTPKGMVESFLGLIGKGQVDPALKALLAGSPIMAQPAQVQNLGNQIQGATSLYGKSLGYELYKEEKFGESLVRLVYIQRLEKHPLIWRFWVYRGPADWQVNSVVFNDQLSFE